MRSCLLQYIACLLSFIPSKAFISQTPKHNHVSPIAKTFLLEHKFTQLMMKIFEDNPSTLKSSVWKSSRKTYGPPIEIERNDIDLDEDDLVENFSVIIDTNNKVDDGRGSEKWKTYTRQQDELKAAGIVASSAYPRF